MRKLILASVSAVALFGAAACSDSGSGTDATTTQSTTPPVSDPAAPTMQPVESDPAMPADPAPAAPAQ